MTGGRATRIVVPMVAFVMLASAAAVAQTGFGRLYIRVYDQTGAVLPGATLTLSGVGIGVVSGVTGILGDFCFVRLPQGDYALSCELEGFESHREPHVRISAGATVSLRPVLQLAPIAETVTVVAPAPEAPAAGIRPRSTAATADLGRLPTIRDPAAAAGLVSGIILDRADLGAFIAGRQVLIGGFGDLTGRNTTWNIEGLNITDMREIGTSPIQYDFDAIDRIEVTSGGVDPSVATGGITLNLVARRGDDTWNGSARALLSGRNWQDNNTENLASDAHPDRATSLDGYDWSSSFQRPIIEQWREFGTEGGGPIWPGHAWGWAAVSRQQIDATAISGDPDDTRVTDLSLKLDGDLSPRAHLSYTHLSSWRSGLGPGYRSSRPIGSVLRTRNPSMLHKIELQAEPADGASLAVRGGYTTESQSLLPVEGLYQPARLDASGEWSGSYRSSEMTRPQWEFEVDALRQSRLFGQLHSLRLGFSYRRTEADTVTRWPADGVVSDALHGLARITRPAASAVRTGYTGLWAGDTFALGRCVISLAARYDRQTAGLLRASTSGSPAYSDLLPSVVFVARDAPFAWSDLSPRLGASYDLTGSGRTRLRASFARYADQLGSSLVSSLSPIATVSELDFPWQDTNGDGIAQPGEIDFAGGPAEFHNVDPLDPGGARGFRTVSPTLSAPRRTEVMAGFEREISFGFVAGIDATWKTLVNDTWTAGTEYRHPERPYTYQDYVLAGNLTGTLPDGSTYSVPYWALSSAQAEAAGAGVDSVIRNRPGYREVYTGVELYATRTLTSRWSAHASFSWQRNSRRFDGTSGISDPTNIYSGEDVITLSDVGGRAELWIGTPHWHLVAGGLYQLPRGFDASANLTASQGNPLVYFVRKLDVDPGSPRKDVRVEPAYSHKLPDVWQLDLGIAKSLTIGDAVKLDFRIDVFNVFNANTPLQVDGRLNARVTNEVLDILQPRTARAGVRFSF